MTHKTKESRKKKSSSCLPTGNCPTRGAAPFRKPRIPSANTSIGQQRNKSRTFAEQTELFVVVVPGFFFVCFFVGGLLIYH
jgi:hypothetical protein